MFIRFYALVKGEDGKERTETCDAKNIEVAKDYFETLYADAFTGEVWRHEEEEE